MRSPYLGLRTRHNPGQGRRPRPLFPVQAADHLFSPDSLEKVGLQNHVDVRGWWEKILANRIPPVKSGSKPPCSHFLLSCSCSWTLCQCRGKRKHQAGPGSRRAGQVPLSLRCVFPSSPLQALKIIYVCKLLLTHMTYSSCLPTGLGTGEFSSRRAEKSGAAVEGAQM